MTDAGTVSSPVATHLLAAADRLTAGAVEADRMHCSLVTLEEGVRLLGGMVRALRERLDRLEHAHLEWAMAQLDADRNRKEAQHDR